MQPLAMAGRVAQQYGLGEYILARRGSIIDYTTTLTTPRIQRMSVVSCWNSTP